jgi:hypothetical protein
MRDVTVTRTEIYEVAIADLDEPDFDYRASTSPRSRCTWRPTEVRLAWKRIDGEWVLMTCDLRCGQVLKDGTLGRNGKVFSFLWHGLYAIPKPLYLVELEKEHHPDKQDG